MSQRNSIFVEIKNGMLAGWKSAPPSFKLFLGVGMGMGFLGAVMGLLVYASAIMLMVAAAWRLVMGG